MLISTAGIAQSYNLSEKVTLSVTHTNIADVLEVLDKQTNFSFTYSKTTLRKIAVGNISWQYLSLQQALEELKNRYQLNYLPIGGTISFSIAEKQTLPVHSETKGGTIKGRIVDFETSQPLPGASVQLEGTVKGTVTDTRGYYEFRDLPIGKYNLLISYIGYLRNSILAMAEEGKSNTYDIKMTAGKSLDAVIIKAGSRRVSPVTFSTDREIISEIRGANAVVSGISNEQINKMADRNAAEIVKRIPGITVADDRFIVIRGMNPRYNQTYLNGALAPSTELYTHAFALDLLPTPIIDRILIFKSPTPDVYGDVTGGSVKIFTKNAQPVRHFDIGIQTGIRTGTTFKEGNTYQGGHLDWLGFDDGTRTAPSRLLPGFAANYGKAPVAQVKMLQAFSPDIQNGRKMMSPDIQGFINYFDNVRVSAHARLYNFTMVNYTRENRIQQVYRQTGNLYSMSFAGMTQDANRITHADQSMEKGRLNIMENLLLKLNEHHSIELKNFFLNEGNKNTSVSISQYNQLPKQDSAQQIRSKDILENFEQRTLYSGNLRGIHQVGTNRRHHVAWNLGYNYYRQLIPDQRNIRFFGQNGFFNAAGSNMTSYRDVFLGMMNRSFITNNEKNYQGALDYTYTITPLLKIKAGAYGLFKNREVERRFFQVNRAGLDGVNLAGFEFAPPGIHDNYGWSDPNLIQFKEEEMNRVWSAGYFPANGKGLAIYNDSQPTDSYVADERNLAFYAMGDWQLLNKRLNIIGGLRVEHDRQRLSVAIVQNGAFIPLLLEKPLNVWLPSVNATYSFADSTMLFRAGYGKTVNRPEFREISPFSDYDFLNDLTIRGNPNLLTARIDNYDLRWEWYPKAHPGEIINAGVFYKYLTHPIEQIRDDQSGAVSFLPTNISYWNADKAVVYGIEAEVRKSLSFIPGNVFRNLSIMLNGALIRSRASKAPVGDSAQQGFYSAFKNRQLQGQAPYVLNTGLFYENPGWGLKFSLTYNISGPTINAVSKVSTKEGHGDAETGPNGNPTAQAFIRPNLLELPRHQLDLSISQRLFKSMNVRLNIQNLLDQAVRIVEDQDYDNKYTAEKNTGYMPGAYPGVSGPLYKGDNIFRRFNTGRYMALSFTYAF
ncbi:carboxypeptidase-like regulatory domain-containing protein [Chitinophaga pendula]|uniref:TonB-dependent receptor n=1 Tax=Chitinophaga TaxID=79328 RepID=UPI0018DF1B48|nr:MULTISPECIES: TonB-dependent receptor [Chitinophaga]UCJ08698.1 carboxypeptidase-like regulatory domain-containing protein [Chitinophaga pendula]